MKGSVLRGLVWRPDIAEYRLGFYPRFLKHSKGKWARKPMELSPWQVFIVGSIHGWRRLDGSRRFRYAYVEIPRKNGKSTLAAAIGLDMFLIDNENGAEIYSAATKRDQAKIIFDEAKRMVGLNKELSKKVVRLKTVLEYEATQSKFEPLSSDSRTLDGLNPHCVLVDELHKHRDRTVFDVFDTALGARRQPLILVITTAGDDSSETVYAQENEYAINVLRGSVEDDSVFAYIATIDKEDKWDDPAAWAKANPNIGISIYADDLERQARKAVKSPSARSAFKRLRLNVRQGAAERAIDIELWNENHKHKIDIDKLLGRKCYGGIDLSSKIDLTAWVKLFEPIEDGGPFIIVPRFWMPADTVTEKEDRDRVQYQRWIDAGLIETTSGNSIDYNVIEDAIWNDSQHFEIISTAYDPWNATQMTSSLYEKGMEMNEFVQGSKSYAEPVKEFDALLADRRVEHGDNPVLKWMAGNMMYVRDKNENKMPSKKASVGRIDGMSATLMALGRWVLTDRTPSIYDKEELWKKGAPAK